MIVADTKFEFGFAGGELVLVDEVGTPDSSRFWPADDYRPGRAQPSFDKQYVRDWLDASGWDREPPPPSLPADVVDGTAARYREAYERVTGRPFDEYLRSMGVDAVPTADAAALDRLREEQRMRFTFEVLVTLKHGLADPQGKAVEVIAPGARVRPTSPTCTWGGTCGSTSKRRTRPRPEPRSRRSRSDCSRTR